MIHTVLWKRHAEEELAEIWSAASDRAAVTKAADDIDQLLRERPLAIGESRSDGRRLFFSFPLGVLYRVVAEDVKVFVLDVWRIDRPRRKGPGGNG
jgi:hypothetical protein